MTPTLAPGVGNGRGAARVEAPRSSSAARVLRAATRARVTARIASSEAARGLLGILAFGRYSGRLFFGKSSGAIMPVTRRQREILDYITKHLDDKGYAPSFEEIARQFGFQSLATVHEHLTNLERKGYIRRTHNESRAIEVVPPKGQTGATELPLLGLVAAGHPIEPVTNDETIAVPDELLPRRGRSYVLRVRVDSMIDEHIQAADYVVVQDRNEAEAGQTVIALVH